jgi:tetratricopeptide (TPR) repeat protein
MISPRRQLVGRCEVPMSATSRREQIEAMLAEMPNDVELRYMLAMEHASAGDDLAAVRCFHELIALTPDYAPAYHQAGRTLQRLNRTAEARAILQAGIPVAQRLGNDHAAGEMIELLQSMDAA